MNQDRLRLIKATLDRRGLSWTTLVSHCEQIVLFGSWAVEAESGSADIDLFCVGMSQRMKTRLVDLVCYSPEIILTERWLGSELANHIAAFGIWLHGKNNWGHKASISGRAITYKRRLIHARISGLRRLWESLAPDYRLKHVVKLRRDVQRLALMKVGEPVEPSPWLDRRWQAGGASMEALHRVLRDCSEPNLIEAEDLHRIALYLAAFNFDRAAERHRRTSPKSKQTKVSK